MTSETDDTRPIDDDFERELWNTSGPRERVIVQPPLDHAQRVAELRQTLEATKPKETNET